MKYRSEKGALSVPASMNYISVKRTKFYDLIGSGQLEAVKIGRKTLVRIDELDRFLASLPAIQSSSTSRKRSGGEA